MEMSVSQEQGRVPVTVFRLKGPVTDEEPLQSQAKQAYEDGTRDIILDLTDVPYMASPGLRALQYIYTLLRTNSPEESDEVMQKGIVAGTWKSPHLKLVHPSQDVLELLRATGYDMFLGIHSNLKGAIASF